MLLKIKAAIGLLYFMIMAGCSTNGAGGASTDTETTGGDTESAGGDTEPFVLWETFPKACPDIYDESILPTFEVEIDNDQWAAMEQDCENEVQEYRPVTFRYGTESVEAMMRLKGNWSWNCDKMQFIISFNETNKNGRFHGVRKIVLDAPWYDPTFLHERVAFFYMQQYGTQYSCVNNARLNVNGEYYGLYANVERLDHEYLERHFENYEGNLYAGGVELKTNEETADTSRIDAFWTAEDIETLSSLVNLEHAVTIWAGLAMLPDPDSYWAGVEINFYLYDHPTDGILFLPYDMDFTFTEGQWSELDSADPITYEHNQWLRERQYEVALSDTYWCEQYVTAVTNAFDTYDVALLETKIAQWSEQIAVAAEEDPNRTFTHQEHLDAVALMSTFPARRKAFVENWLAEGNHCPPNWP